MGSPTVRVDGKDVDASAEARGNFGMQCRVYAAEGRLEHAPPVAWIEAALHGDFAEGAGTPVAAACCAPAPPRRDE